MRSFGESTSFMIIVDHHTRYGFALAHSPACENLKVPDTDTLANQLTGVGTIDAQEFKEYFYIF